MTWTATPGAQVTRLLIEDVKIDNFQTAVRVRNVLDSTFNRITAYNNLIGLDVYGLTLNNFLTSCYLVGERVPESRSVRFSGAESPADSTHVTSEGWMLTANLLAYSGINLELEGVRYFNIIGNIIDWAAIAGVYHGSHGSQLYSGAHTFSGNYIAVGGSAGVAGVLDANAHAPSHKNSYSDNVFVGYEGQDPWTGAPMTRPYGLHLAGTHSASIVRGNRFHGFTDADIRMDHPGSIVTDNDGSPVAPGLGSYYSLAANLIDRNVGAVYSTQVAHTAPYVRDSEGLRIVRASAPPAAGTWKVGERVVTARPAVGQPKAWVCTAAGTPGTWVSEGDL